MRPAVCTNRSADDPSRESSVSALSSVLSRFKVDRFAWNAAVWIYEGLFEKSWLIYYANRCVLTTVLRIVIGITRKIRTFN